MIYNKKKIFNIVPGLACVLVVIILLLVNTSVLNADSNDFEIDGTTLIKYHGTAEEVRIPDGITHIHTSAFEGNTTLKKIVFPDTLLHIGMGAFHNCRNLNNIDFPSKLQIIDNMAFMDCDSLEEVSLSGGITDIGAAAFRECDALKTVTVSSNVEKLGWGAFAQCRNLQSIYVSDSNKTYSEKEGVLFNADGSKLIQFPCGYKKTRYSVPNGVVTIGRDAFQGAGISEVTIPEGVETIEEYAFSDCSALESINLPTTISVINDYAFSLCYNLGKIRIPSSNVTISKEAFKDSPSVILCGIKKSKVQQYAEDANLDFLDIETVPAELFSADVRIVKLFMVILAASILMVLLLLFKLKRSKSERKSLRKELNRLTNDLKQAETREKNDQVIIKQQSEKLKRYEKTAVSFGNQSPITGADPNMKHIQLFMISPYKEKYRPLEEAIRRVFEEAPFFFEIRLARDYFSADTQMENVKKHIASAHGFIAEISDRNANVMMEVGGILMTGDSRPVFSLCQKQCNKDVPSDLKGTLLLEYDNNTNLTDLIRQIKELITREDGRIKIAKLEQLMDMREQHYLSKTCLTGSRVNMPDKQAEKICRKYKTVEDLLDVPSDELNRLGVQRNTIAVLRQMINE